METEINLINAMINVLNYEYCIAPVSNEKVISDAKEIMAAKVNEILKVINNPQGPSHFNDEIDLITTRYEKV
jgi:hypothetical protein